MEKYDPLSKAWDALSLIYQRSGTDVPTFLLAMADCVALSKSKTEQSRPVPGNSRQTKKSSE